MARNWRRFIGTLAIVAGAAAASVPAAAQVYYWNDRPSAPGYYQQPQQRDFFSFPFGGQRYRPPVADYSKAPAPRKLETPPSSTIVVVGDSMPDWPAVIKNQLATEKPSAIVVMLGLNDRIAIRDGALPVKGAEPAPGQKPAAPAAPAEAGEAQPAGADTTEHPVPGHSYDFHTDQWAELYVKRIDAM